MEESKLTKKDYNKIPNHFCKTCLSLKVVVMEKSNIEYCGDCGNTDISKVSNYTWEELYKEKYGKYFLST